MEITPQELREFENLHLNIKIKMSLDRIQEWYEYWNGCIYVAFSGGLDSTTLLHLVRSKYPDTIGVFCDTGLEYPEIRSFVKKTDNIIWLYPKIPFPKVITKYGYPIISKETSQYIYDIRNTKSKKLLHKRLYGKKKNSRSKYLSGKLSNKYHYLIKAPFLISDKCCLIMKKNPSLKYERESGNKPILGTKVSDSRLRRQLYLKRGCNAFTGKVQSTPISFWKREDILSYIKMHNISYSKIYDMGYCRTGCMFCMFGVPFEEEPNKFQLMEKTHPKLYDYCINKLKCGEVLDYTNTPYKLSQSSIIKEFI